jgi:hypothetical protein
MGVKLTLESIGNKYESISDPKICHWLVLNTVNCPTISLPFSKLRKSRTDFLCLAVDSENGEVLLDKGEPFFAIFDSNGNSALYSSLQRKVVETKEVRFVTLVLQGGDTGYVTSFSAIETESNFDKFDECNVGDENILGGYTVVGKQTGTVKVVQ